MSRIVLLVLFVAFLSIIAAVPVAAKTCSCPTAYRPVCSRNGHTFSNTCELKCFGEELQHKGRCSRKVINKCNKKTTPEQPQTPGQPNTHVTETCAKAGEPTVTCSFWGDPHLTGFDGVQFDSQPVGDALLLKDNKGTFKVEIRNHHWGSGSDTVKPTVATHIAIKVNKHDVIEYSAVVDEFYVNKEKITLGQSFTFKNGGSVQRTGTAQFAVTAANGAVITVDPVGLTATPRWAYLNVVAKIPQCEADSFMPSICGSPKSGAKTIIESGTLFREKYNINEVNYGWKPDQPRPRGTNAESNADAEKSCSTLTGRNKEICIFDFLHTPHGHRHDVVEHSKRFHTKINVRKNHGKHHGHKHHGRKHHGHKHHKKHHGKKHGRKHHKKHHGKKHGHKHHVHKHHHHGRKHHEEPRAIFRRQVAVRHHHHHEQPRAIIRRQEHRENRRREEPRAVIRRPVAAVRRYRR